jgi:tetratricopeptide (TPR) repeat protein
VAGLREALAWAVPELGDDHPHVVLTTAVLGLALFSTGDLEAAVDPLARAANGPLPNADTRVSTLVNLAQLYTALRRWSEAEAALDAADAVAHSDSTLPPETRVGLVNARAHLEDRRGHTAEALRLAERAVAGADVELAEDDVMRLEAIDHLAWLRLRTGDLVRAQALFEACSRRNLPLSDRCRVGLAFAELAAGDREAAAQIFAQIFARIDPGPDPNLRLLVDLGVAATGHPTPNELAALAERIEHANDLARPELTYAWGWIAGAD